MSLEITELCWGFKIEWRVFSRSVYPPFPRSMNEDKSASAITTELVSAPQFSSLPSYLSSDSSDRGHGKSPMSEDKQEAPETEDEWKNAAENPRNWPLKSKWIAVAVVSLSIRSVLHRLSMRASLTFDLGNIIPRCSRSLVHNDGTWSSRGRRKIQGRKPCHTRDDVDYLCNIICSRCKIFCLDLVRQIVNAILSHL